MPVVELKQQIEQALAAFATRPLAEAALGLFATLGYRSDRRLALTPATVAGFLAQFDPRHELDPDRALTSDWQAVEFLFQLTDAEI